MTRKEKKAPPSCDANSVTELFHFVGYLTVNSKRHILGEQLNWDRNFDVFRDLEDWLWCELVVDRVATTLPLAAIPLLSPTYHDTIYLICIFFSRKILAYFLGWAAVVIKAPSILRCLTHQFLNGVASTWSSYPTERGSESLLMRRAFCLDALKCLFMLK